jgi:3',5'-cyclic AMP phosphodiesterase CpdA
LSDLHFGRVDDALVTPLIDKVRSLRPDLIVVSGDLTQRARSAQFKTARRFLDALPAPQIIVPGNHDIPMHHVFDRFVRPLEKYRRYICDDLEPEFVDAEIAVLGVNTARSLTIKGGRINAAQIGRLRTRLHALAPQVVRIVVTHHPFDLPDPYGKRDLVGRAPAAMGMFAASNVDLLLAGHTHDSHAGNTAARYDFGGYSAVIAQAGTATSTRHRNQANAFNIIRVAPSRIVVRQIACPIGGSTYAETGCQSFERSEQGWSQVP